jgi:hypothetical protein
VDYARILTGREKPLPVYKDVVAALESPLAFPDLLEPIYREAMILDDETLDRGSRKGDAYQVCSTGA